MNKKFPNFKKDTYLLVTKPSNYQETRDKLLSELTASMKLKGVYITFNKPASTIISELRNKGVEPIQLFFIDTISKRTIKDPSLWDNVIFTQGPESLTELSIDLTNIIKSGIYDFIVLDSINAMLIYNEKELVERFVHFLINKTRHLFVKGVFLSINDPKAVNIINNLSIVSDEVVHL